MKIKTVHDKHIREKIIYLNIESSESDGSNNDQDEESDNDNLDINQAGALIKNPKNNKLFKQKIKENQRRKKDEKVEKKKSKMLSGFMSKIGTNKKSKHSLSF